MDSLLALADAEEEQLAHQAPRLDGVTPEELERHRARGVPDLASRSGTRAQGASAGDHP